jgi:hypothetical protein
MLVIVILIAMGTLDAQQRRVVEIGAPFTLKAAEEAEVRGTTLVVGFERVLSDSRCPEGVQCISAGDVAVSLSVLESDGRKIKVELRAAEAPSVTSERHLIRLLDVQPRPRENRTVPPREYVVRLRIEDVDRNR